MGSEMCIRDRSSACVILRINVDIYEFQGVVRRWYFTVVRISYAYHIIAQVEYVYVLCCAAAADIDCWSVAYPLAILLLLEPRLIRPNLRISPIAGICTNVQGGLQDQYCCCTSRRT